MAHGNGEKKAFGGWGMTDDLVKRLRYEHVISKDKIGCVVQRRNPDGPEAADRIEKLTAALARIAKYDTQAIAMDALRPGERIREKKDD